MSLLEKKIWIINLVYIYIYICTHLYNLVSYIIKTTSWIMCTTLLSHENLHGSALLQVLGLLHVFCRFWVGLDLDWEFGLRPFKRRDYSSMVSSGVCCPKLSTVTALGCFLRFFICLWALFVGERGHRETPLPCSGSELPGIAGSSDPDPKTDEWMGFKVNLKSSCWKL